MSDLPKPAEQWIAFLREGRFMIQRSRTSGRAFFYPRVVEPGTGSTDLEWIEASGRGEVYATTVQRAKDRADDINVALIDLAEGPRMMSRVDGIAPADVRIGMQVEARIVAPDEGDPFVVFVPSEARG